MIKIRYSKNPYTNLNWKKYYKDDINFISDKIETYFPYKNDSNKINFYEDKIEDINISKIKEYNYGFTSRFFYGIYDFSKKKGWVRLNGVSSDDFLIKLGLVEKGFLDVNIGNHKGVFGGKKEIEKWSSIRYKSRFKNNDRICYNLDLLTELLINIGCSRDFVNCLLNLENNYLKGNLLYKNLFNSQLKLLKILRRGDKDRIKLKPNRCCDNVKEYKGKYGYTPKERYKKKYYLMLTYIGKENKVLFEIFKDNKNIREYIEKLLEISNTNNPNFKERKNIIFKKYKELFNK